MNLKQLTPESTGRLLVAAQFALLFGLLGQSSLSDALGTFPSVQGVVVALLLVDCVGTALMALWANPPGNFSIFPKPCVGAALITRGIYSQIRHPMYTSLMMLGLACLASRPEWPTFLLLIGLIAVLVMKALLEESWLCRCMPGYEDYMKQTKRFLPGLV